MKSTLPLLSALLLFFMGFSSLAFSQNNTTPDQHSVYLVGNTYDDEDAYFQKLKTAIEEERTPFTLVFLGDISGPQGLENPITPENEKSLNRVISLAKTNPLAETYIVGGDKDWDDSGEKGLDKIKALEDYLAEAELKNTLLPPNGCPDPQLVELNDYVNLILINSQWFMHPDDRPEAPDTKCKNITELDVWDELEDLIEDNLDKNLLIAAHHPVYSAGQYAGNKLGGFKMIPIYGLFYASFHQNIGEPNDFAHPAYQHFIHEIEDLLHNHQGIIYASGHEKDIQIQEVGDNFHINSGTATLRKSVGKTNQHLFSDSEKGFVKLTYVANGDVFVEVIANDHTTPIFQKQLIYSFCEESPADAAVNHLLVPCKTIEKIIPMSAVPEGTTKMVVASEKYRAGSFKKFLMGEQYRHAWSTPIEVPVLDLKTTYGGLRPYAMGGGLQTTSLKFKAGNGLQYAFRSVDKDTERALTQLTKQTIYKDITQDLITTQHPYGGLVASKLMDATDILHAPPKLYVMPDDPGLGIYQKKFANLLGTLEVRPKKGKKKKFADANDVVSSTEMFRSFYKDNDNRIDAEAYAKARVFDMWVGDWDRHEDNWKWAVYKEGKGKRILPISRDRDHVFSKWQGLIPGLADRFIPNAESFEKEFNNIQQLTWKARHLDRQLASELDAKDWQAAANYIAEKMTDEVIDEAVQEFPKEIRSVSAPEISEKLKSRRAQLTNAVQQFYELLAKEVDIVGSNKREIFQIERFPNGDVLVEMYDRDKKTGKAGKLRYKRHFKNAETKEIRIFGLGNKDEFFIKGDAEKSILIRVIGGKGKDLIDDQSHVSGWSKKTKVYDTKNKDEVIKSKETRILRPKREAEYHNKAFDYSYLAPLPKFRISSGNGFGAELMLDYYKLGFNKPEFKQKYQLKAIIYTINAHRFDFKNWHKHVIGDWDLLFHLRYSSLYDKFPFFYGLGNESKRDEELLDDGFYRTDFNTFQFSPAFVRQFLSKSKVSLGFRYEYNSVNAKNEDFSIFNTDPYVNINGLGRQHLLGLVTSLDLDFRDNPIFSRTGSQLYIKNELSHNFSHDEEKFFGSFQGHIAHYETAGFLTLALRGGGSWVYGNPPFYHYTALGSNTYARTYVRNRFLGTSSIFGNAELRLHLGTIYTSIVPIKFGIYSFLDYGRIWLKDAQEDSDFRKGYGGGFYAAPLSENFTFVFTYGKPDADDNYFRISFGFDLQ